jgi:PAS domain S-box-containing protein
MNDDARVPRPLKQSTSDDERKPGADFLAGGGEMGARTRAFDWAKTSLGSPETWPQSLRSALSILLPSKAQIVLFWGPELITIYNDAYVPTYGAKHPWALGRPARECWKEVWHVIGPLFEEVVRTGEAFWAKEHLFYLQRQDFLEETYYDVSYDPVRIEDGSVGGIFCIVSDQTGRVLGERRLRALRELGARTANAKSASDVCREAAATLAMDPADVPFSLLFLIDDSGLRMKLAGVSGIAIDDLAAGTDTAIDDLDLLACIRDGRSGDIATGTFVSRPPDAAAQQALVLPISSGTQLVGALIVGVSRFLRLAGDYRDFFDLAAARISAAISSVRAYEEERKRAEALVELDRAKTAFFSNVRHEFRTPLTLMLGPLEEALADGAAPLQAPQRGRLEVAHRNSVRLLKLVNSLLDFSRIEAGRVQASYEPVDLSALTADLASNFRSAIERAGLELVVDCPPLSEPVFVDRDMWEKIVLNLLSNAFKFTFEGSITVVARAVGDRAELLVRDTGVGIGKDELPRVFERFHRIEGQRSRTHEGSGIGLALVQELVNLHRGQIRAESEPGHGTTFTVSIPFGSAHLPQDRIGAARTLASSSVRAEAYVEEALHSLPDFRSSELPDRVDIPVTESSPHAGARILLADDNSDMRDYVRRLLSPHFDVETAADGQAALKSIRTRRPDLVLSDVMMPVLDGFGLLNAIRSDPALRDVPVIMLSARAGEQSRVEGLAAGADDYLIKPFSARELMARVESHLKMARLRRDATEALRESEARYRDLVEQTVDGIFVANDDGRYVDANPAGCQMLGMSREEVLDSTILDVIAPEEHSRLPEEIARFGDGLVHLSEWRFRRKDGSYFVGEVAGRRLASGRLQGVVRDITRRKQMQAALQAGERRLRNIFETVAVSLWEEDFSAVRSAVDALKAQGITDFPSYFHEHPEFVNQAMAMIRVLDVNDATVQLFEAKDKNELLGSLPKIFIPESMHVFVGELIALAEGRTYFEAEALLHTVRGNPVYVFFTMVIPAASEPCDRVLFSVFDLTERKRAEALVECQKQSLEMVVKDSSLEGEGGILDYLARSMESQLEGGSSRTGAVVAIHLMEPDGYHFGYVAAPSLPAKYAKATKGMDARLELGCCSSAVVSHQPTIVRDFAEETRWPAFTAEVVAMGLRGCFTTPILSPDKRVLGTFAIYYREPRDPSAHDLQLVNVVKSTVALAIDRKQAQAAQAKLSAIVESSDDAIISKDLNGIITSWNRGAERVFGYAAHEAIGQPVIMLMPPDRVGEEPGILERIRRGERIDHYETVRRRKDGSLLDISLTISPIEADDGSVIGASKIARDITERKRSENLKEVMIAELQHRTRNLLAVVGSIATQTREASDSLADFGAKFRDRLAALSRVQGLLSLGDAQVSIGELVEQEIAALGAQNDHRIEIEGPPVNLPKDAVQILLLALHELGTNALKHGALAAKKGRLAVKWRLKQNGGNSPVLVLDWTESGVDLRGRDVTRPRRGYGRELIENALPYQLNAETHFGFSSDGVFCSIKLPLDGVSGKLDGQT